MRYVSLFIFLLLVTMAHAEVRLSSIFTDNMVLQRESEVPIWGWADPSSTISVTTSWNKKKYQVKANEHGAWRIQIVTPEAGGPYEIQVTEKNTVRLSNVLIGDVWLCSGQSNMEMPMKGYTAQPILGSTEAILNSKNPDIRLYTVPRNPSLHPQGDSKPAAWKVAESSSVVDFSATAYFFGKQLYDVLNIPIGLIVSSYGGSNVETWMEVEWLKEMEGIDIPLREEGLKDKNRIPTMLYNGMIHPLVGFGIKGMIWYQGESNYERPDQYEILFPRMAEGYRKLWNNPQLPFYFTQIAPFDYAKLPPYRAGGKYNSAYIRDAQRKSLAHIPYSGMAVTMDAGEENCIHPANKKAVGERLALLALGDSYGVEGLSYRSPSYDTLEIKGSTMELRFKDAPLGLTSYGKELTTIEIAGNDKVFHPAQATIKGKVLVVSSPKVESPVAVRYAFKDFVVGELFGVNGLPVSSFRTDDW